MLRQDSNQQISNFSNAFQQKRANSPYDIEEPLNFEHKTALKKKKTIKLKLLKLITKKETYDNDSNFPQPNLNNVDRFESLPIGGSTPKINKSMSNRANTETDGSPRQEYFMIGNIPKNNEEKQKAELQKAKLQLHHVSAESDTLGYQKGQLISQRNISLTKNDKHPNIFENEIKAITAKVKANNAQKKKARDSLKNIRSELSKVHLNKASFEGTPVHYGSPRLSVFSSNGDKFEDGFIDKQYQQQQSKDNNIIIVQDSKVFPKLDNSLHIRTSPSPSSSSRLPNQSPSPRNRVPEQSPLHVRIPEQSPLPDRMPEQSPLPEKEKKEKRPSNLRPSRIKVQKPLKPDNDLEGPIQVKTDKFLTSENQPNLPKSTNRNKSPKAPIDNISIMNTENTEKNTLSTQIQRLKSTSPTPKFKKTFDIETFDIPSSRKIIKLKIERAENQRKTVKKIDYEEIEKMKLSEILEKNKDAQLQKTFDENNKNYKETKLKEKKAKSKKLDQKLIKQIDDNAIEEQQKTEHKKETIKFKKFIRSISKKGTIYENDQNSKIINNNYFGKFDKPEDQNLQLNGLDSMKLKSIQKCNNPLDPYNDLKRVNNKGTIVLKDKSKLNGKSDSQRKKIVMWSKQVLDLEEEREKIEPV